MPSFLKNASFEHFVQVALVAFISYAKAAPTPLLTSLSDVAVGMLGVMGLYSNSVANPAAPKVQP